MIGRMIDRVALTALGVVGLYLFFLNAGLGIIASVALTFVCMVLLRRLVRLRPWKCRISPARAEAALLSIAEKGDAEALHRLAGDDRAMTVFRHPDGVFTVNDLFELRRGRGDGFGVIVTCGTDEAVKRYVKAHGIALTDREALIRRIRKTGLYVPVEAPEPSFTTRFRRMGEALRTRPVRPRALLYAVGLIMAYMTTGQTLCLACGLGLMGLTGIKLIDRYAS